MRIKSTTLLEIKCNAYYATGPQYAIAYKSYRYLDPTLSESRSQQ
jgi:hypothetical protein